MTPRSASPRKSFTALLEPLGTALKWVIARVPFDIAKAWPVRKGRRVRGEIEGFAFRTSLLSDRRGAGHFLLVNKKMQSAAGARIGSRVRIWLEPDLAERLMLTMEGEEDPPPVLRALFLRFPAARDGWFVLTTTQRRNHLLGIFYYETADARERRAAKAIQDALRAAKRKAGTVHDEESRRGMH
jgi:hypothetical protein